MHTLIEKLKTFTKSDWTKFVVTALAVGFSVFSIVYFAVLTEWDDMALSFAGIAYALAPVILERLFRFRVQPVLYIFIIAYTVGPLLGSSYQLYLKFDWWDDMLHGFAGLIFAMFGAYLPYALNKKNASLPLCALMAFVFSLAVAGVWEFIEFGLDSLFGTDMQKDTVITSMRPSYLLGKILHGVDGVFGPTDAIQNTVITYPDGSTSIIAGGYLDIGLLDSMHDMLIETLGALIYTVIYIAGKGKKFVLLPVEKVQPNVIEPQAAEEVLQEVAPTQDIQSNGN
ncbi:MAG: hypothetical protein IJD33_00370 [Clostridia bacterium]|nr:hypothetical protein [Clostridia bacterium]